MNLSSLLMSALLSLFALPATSTECATSQPAVLTQCNNAWSRSETSKSGNYRATLLVVFNQTPFQGYNWSAFSMSVKVQKKNWLGIWVDTSPTSISLSGQFSGPRSPVLQNRSYSYDLLNPFTNVAASVKTPVRHFQDGSDPSLPCFSMTHGNYSATVTVGGHTVFVPIIW
jgi:hypothetical protein